MELIISGRRGGKTEACLEWVLTDNEPTDSYPFWQKVILTHNDREADRLRGVLARRLRSRGMTDPHGLFYNLVYSAEEWQRAQIGVEPVQLMFDNADLFLAGMFRGGLTGITWTAREGQPEDKVRMLDDQGGSVEL